MKNLLTYLLILLSSIACCQDSIKIENRLNIKIFEWPENEDPIVRWYAEEKNGIVISIPALEKIKELENYLLFLKDRNENAEITRDRNDDNAFWVYPYQKLDSNGRQIKVDLEIWIGLEVENVFYPIPKEGFDAFDERNRVIHENVVWRELEDISIYQNGKYLLGRFSFGVNPKRK